MLNRYLVLSVSFSKLYKCSIHPFLILGDAFAPPEVFGTIGHEQILMKESTFL